MSIPIIVICGPTATGKSAVAAEVAHCLDSEVINADSMQVYRELQIGTGKPTAELLQRAPHHGVDITSVHERYSAATFKRDIDPILDRLLEAGTPPVVCGGTGLYLRAVIDGLFSGVSSNEKVRAALHDRAAAKGVTTLHAELAAVDPASAERIAATDERRIVRALEVHHVTGKPISELQDTTTSATSRSHALWFGIDVPRETLRSTIADRVSAMFDAGWIDEVRSLLEWGHAEAVRKLRPLGYMEILDALERGAGDIRAIAEADTIVHTRQFAKRQRTWFRHQHPVQWLPSGAITQTVDTIVEAARSYDPQRATPNPSPK